MDPCSLFSIISTLRSGRSMWGPPPNFRPNWGPKGRKKLFWRPPPPHPPPSKGLEDHSPLSQGLNSALLRIILREWNGFKSLLGSEVGMGMRDGPKPRLGVSCFVFRSMFSVWLFFFCARRFNFVTENYPSYHPYHKRLIISPGLCNFVRGFRRAYKPGKVTYSCTKKVLQTRAALVLIEILFEFTRFFKLQNVAKIDAISIQTRRGLISGGLIPGCICLFTEIDL